jgi:hypothetical protein
MQEGKYGGKKRIGGKPFYSLLLLMGVGGLVGTVFGQILGQIFYYGYLGTILADGIPFGLDPPFKIDLRILTITIGFTFNLTVVGVLGVVLGALLHRRF